MLQYKIHVAITMHVKINITTVSVVHLMDSGYADFS